MINTYTVWMEGYAMNGDRGGASCLGTFKANTFEEACQKAVEAKNYTKIFNADKLTVWGCSLHDNELSARATFG
jgi:hypothetical protein